MENQKKVFDDLRSEIFRLTDIEKRKQLRDQWIKNISLRLNADELDTLTATLARKKGKKGVFNLAQQLANEYEEINPLLFAENIGKLHLRKTFMEDILQEITLNIN